MYNPSPCHSGDVPAVVYRYRVRALGAARARRRGARYEGGA
eukprot:SAG31_NODE_3521_length_4163_cov_4.411663_1_plen_40_part_10